VHGRFTTTAGVAISCLLGLALLTASCSTHSDAAVNATTAPSTPAAPTASPGAPSLVQYWSRHPEKAPTQVRDGSAALLLEESGSHEGTYTLPDLSAYSGLIVSLSCSDARDRTGAAPNQDSEYSYDIDLDVAAGQPPLINDTGDHCSATDTTGHLDVNLTPDQLPTQVHVTVGSTVSYSLAVYAFSSAYSSTLTLTYDTPS
jgi:hypothetical protein